MRPALGIDEAIGLILDGVEALGAESASLAAARGRVLAAAVRAPRDLPPWRNASMDGFAVRAADIRGASAGSPARLRVVGQVAAGALPRRAVSRGEAIRIMTGAPVPDGADSVVRVEDTDAGADEVRIHDDRDAHANVRARGEDVEAGALAVDAGTPLSPAAMGVLAAAGATTVRVHRRPRVAILSAGDELVPAEAHDRAVAEQRIVDANAITLRALLDEAGCDVIPLGLAADDPGDIRARIESAPPFDVLLTSGGVSVGRHDHMRAVFGGLGGSILIDRVRIRPGAPLAFGRLGERRWLGLPGNPVSAMVTFELFARPLLRRMSGYVHLFHATVPARTLDPIRTAAPLTHFLRVRLTPTSCGVYEARLTGAQGSGILTSMARADALLVVPETERSVAPGSLLRAIPLRGFQASAPGVS